MTTLNYITIFLVLFGVYLADMQGEMEVKRVEGEYLALLAKADKVDMIYSDWATYYSLYSKNKISPMLNKLSNYKGGKH